MNLCPSQWITLLLVLMTSVTCQQTLRQPRSKTAAASSGTNVSDLREELKYVQTEDEESLAVHSRQKRLIWVTEDGRLALPPGTVLTITPTISLPLVRYPLEGFLSNITMSFPLTIDFDKLGLTDNENPLGVVPPFFGRSIGRSMGRAAGSYLADYIGEYLLSRKTRSADGDFFKPNKKLTDEQKHALHGGERAILYGATEDILSNFGVDGKACLLRAICEIHSKELDHLGLFGEIAKLFLTVTKSKYAHLMDEYVRAQKIGEGELSPGECYPYYKDCTKSIFRNTKEQNKYSATAEEEHDDSSEDDSSLDEVIQLNGIEKEFRKLNLNSNSVKKNSFSIRS